MDQTSGRPGSPGGAGATGGAERVRHLGYARVDTDRHRRTGDPEVVLGTGKSPAQVVQILATLADAHPDRAVLATRLTPEAVGAVERDLPAADVDPVAATATLGPVPDPRGTVCVVTAGTSDLPVAMEAAAAAKVFGAGVRVIADVGVAGLHRLLDVRDELALADCLVVVAGMEGALPSVVGGLVGVPLVAVPTSVGYGSSLGGVAALLAMLNSCAPGVVVTNIDNGFGAGVFGARVARAAHPGRGKATTPPDAGHERIGWLDASAGVSGDMLLGALVDVGVPLEVLQQAVDAVAPEPVGLRVETVRRGGLRALRAHVDIDVVPGAEGPHRAWADVRALLDGADLDDAVRERATASFSRLAAAEAAVHGVAADEVVFHEVGGLDAIADVVGVCAGLHHLGLDRLVGSPVAVGSGSLDSAHGRLPVPAPAVAELLRGVPSIGGPVDAELATPTGAALAVTAVDGWGRQPSMTVRAVGVGAGAADHDSHPNVVRLLIGEPSGDPSPTAGAGPVPTGPAAAGASAPSTLPSYEPAPAGDRPLLIQTNVDDLDPRLWPGVLQRLLAAGASDAWLTPILMKKGRPAHTLSALVRPELRARAEQVVFAETTAIGLRVQEVDKVALSRSELVVRVDDRPVRVKIASTNGRVVNLQPEYDDVAAVAAAAGRTAKEVLAEATALARSVSP